MFTLSMSLVQRVGMALHCSNRKQLTRWSFVRPAACMKEYMTVGPTPRNPLLIMSLLIISAFGLLTGTCLGYRNLLTIGLWFRKPQQYRSKDPNSSTICISLHKLIVPGKKPQQRKYQIWRYIKQALPTFSIWRAFSRTARSFCSDKREWAVLPGATSFFSFILETAAGSNSMKISLEDSAWILQNKPCRVILFRAPLEHKNHVGTSQDSVYFHSKNTENMKQSRIPKGPYFQYCKTYTWKVASSWEFQAM